MCRVPWRQFSVVTCPNCSADLTETGSVIVELQKGGENLDDLTIREQLGPDGWLTTSAISFLCDPASKFVVCSYCWEPLDPYEIAFDPREDVYVADQASS